MRWFGLIGFLLLTQASTAQELRHAADRLPDVFAKAPRLRVDLFIIQERVVPGDTVPIHATVFDAGGKPFTRRQILHLDLADNLGRIVHRQHVLMADGTADSYLAVPMTLSPGGYLLRAYTDFMRNYGEGTFFHKEFEVVTDRAFRRPTAEPLMALYAEGGKAVGGVPNRIIVRYQGLPLGSEIALSGTRSGRLATLYVLPSGVGAVTVVPGMDESIEARHIQIQEPVVLKLSNESGVSMRSHVTASEPRIILHLPRSKDVRRQQLALVLVGPGTVTRLTRSAGSSDSVRFNIPEKLPPGLYQAVAMDDDGRELASRFVVLGQQPAVLALTSLQKRLGFREQAEIGWDLQDALSRPVKGKFTAAVVDLRAVPQPVLPHWTETWLGPDLTGFTSVRSLSSSDQDLVLATRRASWLPTGWQSPGYVPTHGFRSVLHLSGKVKRTDGLPLRDSTQIMLFLHRRMLGYDVDIRDGRFDFPVLFDFRGDDELFFAVHRKDSLVRQVRVEFDFDSLTDQRPVPVQAQYARDPFADFVLRKRATEKSYRFFTSARQTAAAEEPNPNLPFEKELRGADVTVRIDDYVVFPTVADVVREIVPGLRHRKSGDRDLVRVFLYSPVVTNDPILSSDDPLYIIDGRMTRSTSYFLGIDPADLISISIVRNVHKLQHFGYLGKNGVVLVRTRKPDAIRRFTDNTVLSVQGLNPVWNGDRSPVESSRIPDLRTVLARRVKDAGDERSLKFRTGDISGKWLVRIQGYTDDGWPVQAQEVIDVGAKP